MPLHDALLPDGFAARRAPRRAGVAPGGAAGRGDDAAHAGRLASSSATVPTPISDTGSVWSLCEVGRDGAVLVRPDGHVAWRIAGLPDDPRAALDAALRRLLSLPDAARAAETA
jgi:hypothetical protein